jgi:hypothetical protein
MTQTREWNDRILVDENEFRNLKVKSKTRHELCHVRS